MLSFAWDERKNRANKRKHGISFEFASSVFLDPLALSMPDCNPAHDEERWLTMGQTDGATLVVAHTVTEKESGDVIRIISARKATNKERREYEDG
jgi:uncharacterized DUF497 family protein